MRASCETCCVIFYHHCTVCICTACMLQAKQLCWKVCRMAQRWPSQAQELAHQSQLGCLIHILQLAANAGGLPDQGRLLQQCQAKYMRQQRWWKSLMVMMTLSLLLRSCGHDMLAESFCQSAQTMVDLLQLLPGLLTSWGLVTFSRFCTHNTNFTVRPSRLSFCTRNNLSALPAAAAVLNIWQHCMTQSG